MGSRPRSGLCLLALAVLLGSGRPSVALDFEVLHRFNGENGLPRAELLLGNDGIYYGTASQDGSAGLGSVFTLQPDGSGGFTFARLHEFTGPDGSWPQSALIQASDGNFYGTTVQGGDSGLGTVFRMDSLGNVTVLHSFSGGTDGQNPYAALLQGSDGNLYGTASAGGSGFGGTLYQLDLSGNFTVVHSLSNAVDGAASYGALVEGSDGMLYGTASTGGPNSGGTVFRTDFSGNFAVLAAFSYASGGFGPHAGLVQGSDGNFYGTTFYGGSSGTGTVFQMDSVGDVTVLHSLNVSAEGTEPSGRLLEAAPGLFYGTLEAAGSNWGSVFSVDTLGNFALLHAFQFNGDGREPVAGLIQGSDGNYYGTTLHGGAGGSGSVYQMDSLGNVTTVFSFQNNPDGALPLAPLIEANDGNFYGTTFNGGSQDQGTLYRIDAAGNFIVLDSLPFFPFAPVIQATDGNLYGTTQSQAFESDLAGNLNVFSGGGGGLAGLVEANDGDFYGVTFGGGSSFLGTLYRMDPAGNLTVLHSFGGNPDGAQPRAALIQASDGFLYGTTYRGGTADLGTVFRSDLAGNVTILHSFTGNPDGATPYASLIEASDGNLYGTTSSGGAGLGTVFRMDLAGNLSVAHAFNGTDGDLPLNGLIEALDGSLYGTTAGAGDFGSGTIFRMDFSGNVTVVDSLPSFSTGLQHFIGLVQGSDGAIYGTDSNGNPGSLGNVFRLSCFATVAAGNDGPVCDGGTLQLTAATIPGATYSWTGPNGFTSSEQNPVLTGVPAQQAGTYSVTAIGATCYEGSTAVVVNPLPAPTITPFGPTSFCDGGSVTLDAGGGYAAYLWSPGGETTQAVTASASGSYSVTVTDGNGCSGTSNPVVVTANPLPAAAATGTAAVCSGGSTPLTGAGAVACHWAPPDGLDDPNSCAPTASPLSTTSYTLTVTDGNGCVSPNFSNGDFETGEISEWRIDGIEPPPSVSSARSHSGTYSALLGTESGQEPAGDSSFSQAFPLPPAGGVLSFWYYGQSTDSSGLDFFEADITDMSGAVLATVLQVPDDNDQTWTNQAFDLGPLAGTYGGQNVRVKFSVHESGGAGNTSVDLDDISLPQADQVTVTVNPLPTPSITPSGATTFCAGGSVTLDAGAGYAAYLWSPGGATTQTIAVGASGSYSVMVTDANGCQGTSAHVAVTVNPLPTPSITPSGPTTFCAGGSVTLDAGAGYAAYLWSPGGATTQTIVVSTSGSYSVTVTDNSGCPGTSAPTTATVNPNPAPTITVSHCLTPNTSGQTASAPANAGDTYAWTITGGTIDSGQGTDTISFTSGGPATLMTLNVTETTVAGCTGNAGDTMQVNFNDVPASNPFYTFICTIARHAITAGCGGGNFCPANLVLRSQMAVFLLRGEHGSVYVPPPAVGIFGDVPASNPFAPWIEQLYNESITGGCSTNPLLYCPSNPVSRAGMAVFLLVAEHGTGYVPPACIGLFTDVACPSPFADWIEQLYNEGITGGCNTNPLMYCPNNLVTRAQMSVFLTVTFNLQ